PATAPTSCCSRSLHDALPIFDLLLAADAQLLLGLDLDRQPVRVPAGYARDVLAAQRVVPADEVLDRTADDVVDPGPAVRSRTSSDRKSTRLNSSHVKISYAVF